MESIFGEQPWYAVRCVFRLNGAPGLQAGESAYEERITLWRAGSFDEAIALAEAEAHSYLRNEDDEFLGLAQAYHLFDGPEHGREIFSLVRTSSLNSHEYLAAFFDTGQEHSRNHSD